MTLYRMRICIGAVCLALLCGAFLAQPKAALAKGFSFSESEAADAAELQAGADAQQQEIETLLAMPCREKIAGKKVAVLVAERKSGGGVSANLQNYGVMFGEINQRLREVGFTTYTQEEITNQIAQAQIEAQFSNNPDDAISAARRLGASVILRGLVESRTSFNPVAKVNEVAVDMSFTMVNSAGKQLGQVTVSADSFAGADVTAVAMRLVKENARLVAAKLYAAGCSL